MNDQDKMKKLAAEEAVKSVEQDMIVGLGTGSTASFAIVRLGQRVKEERLRICAVATSVRSEALAKEHGIPMIDIRDIDGIDLTIDGADESDGQLNLIKGGGGALLREKIVASHSRKLLIITDESKLVKTLGDFPLPVEIVPFAANLTLGKLTDLGGHPSVRQSEGKPYITDNGNWIADCRFGAIPDPEQLESALQRITGVVENGLFIGLADRLFIGKGDGSVLQLAKEEPSHE